MPIVRAAIIKPAPKPPVLAVAPPPGPPPPMQHPQPISIMVDNAQTLQMIEKQQAMIVAHEEQMTQTNTLLRELIAQIEPGKSFTVEVTEWTTMGRIKSLKITKE